MLVLVLPNYASAAWKASSPPLVSGASSGSLSGISCLSTGTCIATGKYTTAAQPTANRVLLDSWNGSTWSAGSVSPAGAKSAWGSSISCPASGSCALVGGYQSSASGKTLPLALISSTGIWTQKTVPVPAGTAAAELFGVSCSSASSCVGVGYYRPESGTVNPTQVFVARWNGSTWSQEAVPLPAGGNGGSLSRVSCPAANSCVAVGGFSTWKTGGSVQEKGSLIETWDGTHWTAKHIGAETSATLLQSIACPTAGSCITLTRPGVAWKLSGGVWSEIASPHSAAKFEILDGACASIGSCAAVGIEYQSSGFYLSFGSEWNGTSWTSQGLGSQGGLIEGLTGVSCGKAGSCIAVGASIGAGGEKPLAALQVGA